MLKGVSANKSSMGEKMNITITGKLGSGKSSISKELKKLGYEVITAGTIFRDIANERGISIVELNELAKDDPSIDNLIDERSKELGKIKDKCIFDCRLGWFFIPDSLKIFIDVDIKEAAKRILNDPNRVAETYESVEKACEEIKRRQELEKERYLKLYNADIYDLSNYDVVLDSTDKTIKELVNTIVSLNRMPKSER